MIRDSGYDPNFGPSGGYLPGSFQGGPDMNAGRDAIAQAMLAQQGMQPPQMAQPGGQPGGQQIGGGMVARGPDQGAPYRQMLGNQGWAMEGNTIYDPSGAIVGRHGLQQYGAIPGYRGSANPAGPSLNPAEYHYGSSLSGGMAPGTGGNAMATSNASMDFADPSMQGFEAGVLADPSAQGPVTGPGMLGFQAGGGMLDVLDPGFESPASPPTGQIPDPEDPGFTTGTREASLSTPATGWGGWGGWGGSEAGAAGSVGNEGVGGFDPGGGGGFDPGGSPGGVG